MFFSFLLNTDLSAIADGTVTGIIKSMYTGTGKNGYYIFPNGLKLYCGYLTVTTSTASGSGAFCQYYGSAHYDYPSGVSFNTVMSAIATISGNGAYHNADVRNVTTTGFDLWAGSNSNGSYPVYFVILGR
jgi:hypothetical protein